MPIYSGPGVTKSQGFTAEKGVLTGTLSGREIDLVDQASTPLALADTSAVNVQLVGPAGQVVSPTNPVLDIGQALDYSIIRFLRETNVQVPATLLLHFASAFAIPRLMQTSESYGAARSILLHATLQSLTDQVPSEVQLIKLAEIAQQLGLTVSPHEMMSMFTDRASELVSRRALPSLIEFMIAEDDVNDEFDLIRDLPPYDMKSFAGSISQLSHLLKDTSEQRPLESILNDCTRVMADSPFMKAIHSLIRVREGYQMTTVPTSLGYAIDNTSLDLPGIIRWDGMDKSTPSGPVAGQFHFFIAEKMFSEKISIVDVAKTIAYLDDLIVNLPTLDVDLTSLVDTVVRSGNGRAFNTKPSFGTVRGRVLIQPEDGIFGQDDPVANGMLSLLSSICLSYVFDSTKVAPVLSRINGFLQAYKQGVETTPFALAIRPHAETFAIVYTSLVALRRMLEEILEAHPMFSKRYDNLDVAATTAVIDTEAIVRYLELRNAGFEPFFTTPAAPNSPQSLTSPAQLAVVPAPFRLSYPDSVHITQQPWYNISSDEDGRPIITLDEAPMPRFLDGRPVHLSTNDIGTGPLVALESLIGKALTHRSDAVWQIQYGDLLAPVDFSQFISLLPVKTFLDSLTKRKSTDSLTLVIADLIAARNPQLVDLSISVANNAFILRSKALARSINGGEKLMTAAARIYTRFAETENTDAVTLPPIMIGNYEGYAYKMGSDPTVIFPHFTLYVENTQRGMSNLDWYSIKAPVAVARPMTGALSTLFDVDTLFRKPAVAAEIRANTSNEPDQSKKAVSDSKSLDSSATPASPDTDEYSDNA
jgi:hypothetical protein